MARGVHYGLGMNTATKTPAPTCTGTYERVLLSQGEACYGRARCPHCGRRVRVRRAMRSDGWSEGTIPRHNDRRLAR